MKLEWDEEKEAENQAKHDVRFNEAEEIFFDPNAVERYDEIHSIDEDRFIIIGFSSR